MKKLIHTFATLTLLAVLAACGGNAAPPAATESVSPTESVPTLAEETPAPTEAPTEAAAATTEAPAATEAAPTVEAAGSTVSFAANVYPILEAKCIKCHGVEQVKEGLNLMSYNDLMAGSFNGPVLVPGNADESLLVQLIVKGKMPNRGDKVTDAELQIIKDWINQGALNN